MTFNKKIEEVINLIENQINTDGYNSPAQLDLVLFILKHHFAGYKLNVLRGKKQINYIQARKGEQSIIMEVLDG